MSGGSPTVTVNVFSGRPNPYWTLSDEQTAELKGMLTNLSESNAVEHPVLGYRGFIIENTSADPELPDEVEVYKHVLTIDQGGNVSFRSDDNNIEDWLTGQARELGFGGIIDTYSDSSDDDT